MNELQEKARKLRRDQGLTASEIAIVIKKPKTTVSRWIKGIELTKKQQIALAERVPSYRTGKFAAKFYSDSCKALRESARNEGRKAWDFSNLSQREWILVGISLYWGEVTKKTKNSLEFCNSDENMIRAYLKFLEFGLGINKADLKIFINCYTDEETAENIEEYWLDVTGLSRSQMTKSVVNNSPKSSKQSRKKMCEHGTCRISLHNTEKTQKVLGMIESLGGFRNESIG